MNPLVSIITPCYNGELFLDDYFKSILNQTYDNLELIFINDGSVDATEKIAQKYELELEKKGIQYTYVYQNNSGQAVALNKGLKIFQGKYLVWPDSDDILTSDSIEKRVAFLENNPRFGFVRSNAYFFDFNTKDKLYRASNSENRFNEDIFLDLILETSYCYCGCYMIRKETFLEMYPERQILESNAGQNWQLLIPISGNYKCGYIDEDLYHIAVRQDSHSRKNRTLDEALKRQNDLKEILISSVELSNRNDNNYAEIIDKKYLRIFYRLCFSYDDLERGKVYYKELKKKYGIAKEDYGIYLKNIFPRTYKFYDIRQRGIAKIKRSIGLIK